jgi:hypothetical protein
VVARQVVATDERTSPAAAAVGCREWTWRAPRDAPWNGKPSESWLKGGFSENVGRELEGAPTSFERFSTSCHLHVYFFAS